MNPIRTVVPGLLGVLICVGLAGCMQGPPPPDMADTGDFTLGPKYTNAPETKVVPGVPVGDIHEFTMKSADSKIYPGIKPVTNAPFFSRLDAYGNRVPATSPDEVTNVPYVRRVEVYIPKQYVPGTRAPFIVVQDGPSYLGRVTKVLDNLIAQHRVPVMIGVFVNHGGGDAQGSERGLEYDTLSGNYAEFIETEVLPKIAKDYNVKFTKNPDGRATMGGSSGGVAAFTMAWFHPEWYHRVLTYSGTYVNQQSPFNPETPHGAWEYHDHIIAQSPVKPLRIWMEVGERDLQANDPEASYHNWPMANKRMAAVLKEKGYAYHFVFCLGARHVDGGAIAETLPDAMVWLWKGYPIK